jgi:hypothetical protein
MRSASVTTAKDFGSLRMLSLENNAHSITQYAIPWEMVRMKTETELEQGRGR